jgi:ABC-2 type transport system permease protein
MRKVLAVIRREFVTRVRSRAFVISTVIGPVIMILMFAMPILLSGNGGAPKKVAVLDAVQDGFGKLVAQQLNSEMRDTARRADPRYDAVWVPTTPERLPAVRDSLVALTGVRNLGAASLDGILVVTDAALGQGRIRYMGVNVGSPSDMSRLERSLRSLVIGGRLQHSGLDPLVVMGVMRPVDLKTLKVSEGRLTAESGEASFILAYAMSFILYIALLLYGIQVMNSVVEEKSSRIIEVLISSLSPFQLLLGKVLGVGAVGLLQLGIWVGTATVLTSYKTQIAALVGASPGSVASLAIPTIPPMLLVVFLIFFVLGFLFYASAYAAVGSMCSSQQDAQQAQMPVTIIIAAGLFIMFSLLSEPNGSTAHVLTYVPFFAPFVTPVRFSFSSIAWWEVLLSIGAMVAGLLIMTALAGRIYRFGILKYGKKATWGDAIKWLRA